MDSIGYRCKAGSSPRDSAWLSAIGKADTARLPKEKTRQRYLAGSILSWMFGKVSCNYGLGLFCC